MTNDNNPGNNPEYKNRNTNENVQGDNRNMKRCSIHDTILIH